MEHYTRYLIYGIYKCSYVNWSAQLLYRFDHGLWIDLCMAHGHLKTCLAKSLILNVCNKCSPFQKEIGKEANAKFENYPSKCYQKQRFKNKYVHKICAI